MTRREILRTIAGNTYGLDKSGNPVWNRVNGSQMVLEADATTGQATVRSSLSPTGGGAEIVIPLSSARASRLRRAIASAKAFNPIDAPIATDQPTLGIVHDASLVYTNCDPAAASTASKMNLLGGTWTKDGANNRWAAVTDYVTTGAHGAINIVEFMTDAPVLEIKVSGGPLYVEVGGYALTKATTGVPVGGTGGSGSVLATLDYSAGTGALVRAYRVWVNGINYVYSIGISAGGYRLWAPRRDDILRMYFESDSYGAETVGDGTTALPNLGMLGHAALKLGIRDVWNGSEGGTGYIANSAGAKTTFPGRIAAIATAQALGSGLDLGVVFGSINDNNQGTAAVAAVALPYYRALRAATPGVPWIIFGAQAGTTGPSAALLAVEAGISQAVTAMNDPLMVFVPVSSETLPWIDSGNSGLYIGADNVHPSIAGHSYHGDRIADGILWGLGRMLGLG